MNGSDYIAQFLVDRGIDKVFLMTGGACAFMVDAIGQNDKIDYHCFQHEQAAAIAADAVWRLTGKPGVTMATSGPGATNLLTGIACSYFDSIPTIHLTGQVNMRESATYIGAKVRQAGFQETNIVDMVKPICKYAVQVKTIDELKKELIKAYNIAMTGRMGPVLIDIPMNIQQEEVHGGVDYDPILGAEIHSPPDESSIIETLRDFFEGAERPLIYFGAGVGLSGSHPKVEEWISKHNIPFVSSWNGLTFFNHNSQNYVGQVGVYGNRGANYIVQNCDRLLVLGSRLDNRQRSGNSSTFAPGARVHVIDIDGEELKKYAVDGYTTSNFDLRYLPNILDSVTPPSGTQAWKNYVSTMRNRFLGRDISTFSPERPHLSPYLAIQTINRMISEDAIVIADTGASLCWIYQTFHRTRQALFTAAGNSTMGYSLPAAIGAALVMPERQIVCFIGDGGFQVNLQELQTIRQYGLNITIIIMNNGGYGIIKQFQDSYMNSRYEASGRGYGTPDFAAIAHAYGLGYRRVEKSTELSEDLLQHNVTTVVDIIVDPNTLIEPKLEMGRPINDQFPYVSDDDFKENNSFVDFERHRKG